MAPSVTAKSYNPPDTMPGIRIPTPDGDAHLDAERAGHILGSSGRQVAENVSKGRYKLSRILAGVSCRYLESEVFALLKTQLTFRPGERVKKYPVERNMGKRAAKRTEARR